MIKKVVKKEVIKVYLSRSKYPESAAHIEYAIEHGASASLTLERDGADENRKKSLKGITPKKGKDRDEYPFAMCKEGGKGASVRYISPSDNRGAEAFISAKLRGYPDGTTFIIVIVP